MRITITSTFHLLLKQQWFLNKKMLKLTDDKSIKAYVPKMMGLIGKP